MVRALCAGRSPWGMTMKTLLHTARNHSLNRIDVDGNAKLIATTEVVLTLTEPKYAVIEGGKLAKYPDTETIRFEASSDSLRRMAEEFETWADELDDTFGDLETTDDSATTEAPAEKPAS